jgi:RNA polymerase II elongation factor ELL
MKDNTYHLQRHIWNDVSEDWPFYTEEERQAFRRSKPQNLTPPGSDGSTGSVASGHSSSSSHPASPQPSLKRSASSAYLGGDASPMSDHIVSSANALAPLGPQAKKKRVSNYVKPSDLAASRSPMSSLGRSPSNSRSPLPASSTNVMNMTTESGESKTNAWLKTTTATSGVSETSKASSATAAPRFVQGDFLTKFDRVIHSDQRRLYKAEFNKDYTRYMALHRQLEKVSQRFTKLERQLQNTPETSHEHKVN